MSSAEPKVDLYPVLIAAVITGCVPVTLIMALLAVDGWPDSCADRVIVYVMSSSRVNGGIQSVGIFIAVDSNVTTLLELLVMVHIYSILEALTPDRQEGTSTEPSITILSLEIG